MSISRAVSPPPPNPGTHMTTLESKNSMNPIKHSDHIYAVSREGIYSIYDDQQVTL